MPFDYHVVFSMTARIGRFFANRYTLAYGTALVAHLLFFVFYAPLSSLVPQPRIDASARESRPMTFEFVELPDPVQDERPPDATSLRSDRVSRAKDLHDLPLPQSHLPYTNGLVQSPSQFQPDAGRDGDDGERGETDARTRADREEAEPNEASTDFASLLNPRRTWTPQPAEERVVRTSGPARRAAHERTCGATLSSREGCN